MKAWIFVTLCASLLLAAAAPSRAQTLEHIFSNPQVVAGDLVPNSLVLQLAWTGCGSWGPAEPIVTTTNNVVTVTQAITRFGSQCIPGATSTRFYLGIFPPSTYTLVYQAEELFTGLGTYPALTTQFTVVGGATPTAVSAMSSPSAAALVAGLFMIGLLARARRRQGC